MSEKTIKDVIKNFFSDTDGKKLLRILLIGEMETGKSTISARLFEIAKEVNDDLTLIYDTATNIENIVLEIADSEKPLFVILDDPQYDAIISEKMKIARLISQIRHITNNDTILALISHGIRLLPPILRNSEIKIYTSTFNNNYENYELENELGTYYYNKLEQITYRKKILREAKGKAIAQIISKKPFIVDFKKPKLELQISTQTKVFFIEDPIDREILKLRLQGKKLQEIAKKVQLHPSRISRRIKKIITKYLD